MVYLIFQNFQNFRHQQRGLFRLLIMLHHNHNMEEQCLVEIVIRRRQTTKRHQIVDKMSRVNAKMPGFTNAQFSPFFTTQKKILKKRNAHHIL